MVFYEILKYIQQYSIQHNLKDLGTPYIAFIEKVELNSIFMSYIFDESQLMRPVSPELINYNQAYREMAEKN